MNIMQFVYGRTAVGDKRIGIFSVHQKQQPFCVFDVSSCLWRVWISYNSTVTSGTYLELHPTGAVDRVTVNNNSIMEVTKIC